MKKNRACRLARAKALAFRQCIDQWASAIGTAWQWAHDISKRLRPLHKHWLVNVALGIAIEIGLIFAEHHFEPVVAVQNWGLDVVTRLNRTACSAGEGGPEWLKCPAAEGRKAPPVLIDVDDETWRSSAWGGGEPARAPRDRMATLIERAFDAGARQIVLDILVEDQALHEVPASVPDQDFANRLRTLMGREGFKENHRLVLVRTERLPLPQDASASGPAFASELRRSAAVDAVVKESGGSIVVAAPYFQIGPDRRLRDWELFKVVCERDAKDSSRGHLRVVPSVQLATAAFSAGKSPACRNAPLNQAGESFKGCADTHAAHADDTVWKDFTACMPFPAVGAAELGPDEAAARACALALQLKGRKAFEDIEACKSAKPPADEKSKSKELAREGIEHAYWSSVKPALGSNPGDLAREGGPENRVIFRYTSDTSPTINAGQFLAARGNALEQYKPLLSERVVVIGQTYAEAADSHITPLGRMAGAMVLVNAIDSMSRHGLMQWPHPLVKWGVVLLVIVVGGFAFAWWTSAIAAILTTLFVVATAGVASFLFFRHGLWLDFAGPITGILIHSLWAAHEEREELTHLKALHGAGHH
jgi:CHASE2 domain-containing sensor protein